jgi:hypothetical protein
MSAIDSLSFHAGGNSIRARFLTPGCIQEIRDALEAVKAAVEAGEATEFKPEGMQADNS